MAQRTLKTDFDYQPWDSLDQEIGFLHGRTRIYTYKFTMDFVVEPRFLTLFRYPQGMPLYTTKAINMCHNSVRYKAEEKMIG